MKPFISCNFKIFLLLIKLTETFFFHFLLKVKLMVGQPIIYCKTFNIGGIKIWGIKARIFLLVDLREFFFPI